MKLTELANEKEFVSMPPSAQALYFHLILKAAEDGAVNEPHKVMAYTGCSEDDLKKLVTKGLLKVSVDGIYVARELQEVETQRFYSNGREKKCVDDLL